MRYKASSVSESFCGSRGEQWLLSSVVEIQCPQDDRLEGKVENSVLSLTTQQ